MATVEQPPAWPRGLLARATAAAVSALALLGCGSHTAAPSVKPSGGHRAAAHRSRGPLRVTITKLGELPAPVEDAASAPLNGGRFVLLGGLDAGDASTAAVTVLDGAAVVRRDALPIPQHDAQAAQIGCCVYVFGGGVVTSFDHVLRYDPSTGAVSQVGRLPSPASDVAVAKVGQTAYVVGGYDGAHWLDTILAWRPPMVLRLAGRLPFGLRYAAVAAAGSRVIIVGGTSLRGVSNAIFSFDPATSRVERIGRLPVGLTHASAAYLGGRVLVLGGRRQVSADPTRSILAIDPISGVIRQLGRLPHPLSDAAVARVGDRLVVAGGESTTGVQRSILLLTVHHGA